MSRKRGWGNVLLSQRNIGDMYISSETFNGGAHDDVRGGVRGVHGIHGVRDDGRDGGSYGGLGRGDDGVRVRDGGHAHG